jgi:hypothetical protein
MQLPRYAEAGEEVGDQSFCFCRRLLIGNIVHFRPHGNIIHSDQKVSVSLVAPWKGTCYIDGYHLERRPNIVLVHLVPNSSPEAATCCALLWPLSPQLSLKLHRRKDTDLPRKTIKIAPNLLINKASADIVILRHFGMRIATDLWDLEVFLHLKYELANGLFIISSLKYRCVWLWSITNVKCLIIL